MILYTSPLHTQQAMRQERGYDYEDTCTVCPEKLPNYEEKIKSFYEEHIHSDEVRECWDVFLFSFFFPLNDDRSQQRPVVAIGRGD